MTVINKALEGKMIGTSAWHTIHQVQIEKFVEATLEVRNGKMEINYGIENLKLGQTVLRDDEGRLWTFVKSVTELRGTVKVVVEVKFLIRDPNLLM